MSDKGIEIGEIPPQRELKGYSKTTEVVIPVLQMLVVMVAMNAAAGLLIYVVIYIGPEFWKLAVAALLLVGTVALTFMLHQYWRAVAFAIGSAVFTAWMVNADKLVPLWPWGWLWEEFWQPWKYTAWLGPVVGCTLIIWRFANEIRDPFWPRIAFKGDKEESPKPKVILRDRPVFVRGNGSPQRWAAPAVVEKDQDQEVEEDTLYDDMYEFIVRAFTRGLERSRWFGPEQDRFRFPSGKWLTKSYFNHLVNTLVESRHVDWDGPGTAKYFTCDIETVIYDWGMFSRWDAGGRPGESTSTGRAGGPVGGR